MQAPEKSARVRRRPLLIALAIVAGLSATFLIDLCDLVYQCGCRSLWNGADAACNIHNPSPPHCPWCATGWWGFVVPLGSVVASQVLILFGPSRAGSVARIAAAALAFPLVGTAVAIVFGLALGYWS